MSNTNLRILSAIIMIALVLICLYFGKVSTLFFTLIVGVVCIDELLLNFLKIKRFSKVYLTITLSFILIFSGVNIFYDAFFSRDYFNFASVMTNIFLMYYLFFIPMNNKFMKNSGGQNPYIFSLITIFPILALGIYFETEEWKKLLAILFLVTYGMDTGAWFFGKNFGRRKLWPEVSPKKTVEGFLGGIFVAMILGTVAWNYFYEAVKWFYPIIFGICGALSQVGDLIQSKIKREFEIKDSSSLIPGHGGVYDRIDSLIFLSPFFTIVVKYLRYNLPL